MNWVMGITINSFDKLIEVIEEGKEVEIFVLANCGWQEFDSAEDYFLDDLNVLFKLNYLRVKTDV